MAGKSLGTLTLDLIAKIGGFTGPLDKAERHAAKRAAAIEKGMKQLGAAMGTVIAAGATAAAYAIKSTIDSMDEMSKAAQKVGLPTEDFSKLTYAASLADVSMDTLVGSLGKLTKAQSAALKETSQQALVFDALGISVKDATGNLRNSADVLSDFADAFKAGAGSPELMAAGFSLFGRSFQELIPLLKDGGDGIRAAGAELESFGGVLSTEAGQAAEEFNDNLTRLKSAAAGLGLQVASDLLPQLVSLTDNLVALSKDGERTAEMANSVGNAFEAAGTIVNFVGGYFTAFGDVVEGLTTGMIGLYESAAGLVSLDWNRIKAGMAVANEGADLAYYGGGKKGPKEVPFTLYRAPEAPKEAPNAAKLRLALAGGAPKPKAAKKEGKSEAEKEAERLLSAYESLVASQKEQIALFGNTTIAAQVRYDTEIGALKGLDAAKKAELILGAEKLDLMNKDADALKKALDLEETQTKARDAGVKATSELIENMEFELALLGMTNAERERAIALRYADANATSEQKARIVELSDSLRVAGENEAFFNDLKLGLSDAFVDFVSGAKSAKEAFGDFADMLFKRALEFVADKAIEAMFDAFSGKQDGAAASGSGGGGWGGILSAFMGMFGGGRAAGGPVSAGKFYEVGEGNQPELLNVRGRQYMIPGNDGRVTPMRGGGGAGQVVNFHLGAPTDPRTQSQIAARMAFETQRATSRNR